jgi:uncharacterized protein (UPF0332 family)
VTLRYEAEIRANLERAAESLAAARELAAHGYFDFAASRAYYAAFYAATALLLAEELSFSKHSGVIAHIHQRFVKTGRLAVEHGRNLNWLFELRGTADYGGLVHVSAQDAERAIVAADEFVNAVQTIISSLTSPAT